MVLADGIIDAKELETLYRIGTEQYGLTQDEITATVRDAGSSFIIPTTLEGKVRFLYNLAEIAYADGVIDHTEVELMKLYIAKMGFEDQNIDGIADFLFHAAKDGKKTEDVIKCIID